jgi:DNA-binding CsgD family transcriptional regulator
MLRASASLGVRWPTLRDPKKSRVWNIVSAKGANRNRLLVKRSYDKGSLTNFEMMSSRAQHSEYRWGGVMGPSETKETSLDYRPNGKSPPGVAVQALDQLAAGVIVTDSGAAVVEMNRAGESIVRSEDGLLIREDRLCARRVFETTKIEKLISAATAEGKPGAAAGRMLIGRSDALPAYVLTVAPLRAGFAINERRLALVVVVDPVRHAPSETDLAEFFGLSPAEARLAAAMMAGKRLSAIAADRGVQITTVRTQLASILKKVGVKRQSDLLRVLSSTGIGSVSLAAGWLDVALDLLQLPLSLVGA